MCKVKIEYSIVSRGTEKYNNCGYMGISGVVNSYRYIINVDHNIKEVILNKGYLMADSKYNIYNIIFSRFQLITALTLKKQQNVIYDNVLIYGLGNVGITCLLYLLDNNYKKISIFVRNKKPRIELLSKIVKEYYNIDINFISSLNSKNEYKTFIDTTGNSQIIKSIFDNVNFNSTIIILSTPRDDEYLISPLIINRKNLTIIGGHEFNGITSKNRQIMFEKLLINNEDKLFLNKFINVYDYSFEKLNSIKKQKLNFIEIFKY
ncbi:MAG: hypothetical protein PUD07_02250 [bacterium]|nr:hypothetical protein [bacterium]